MSYSIRTLIQAFSFPAAVDHEIVVLPHHVHAAESDLIQPSRWSICWPASPRAHSEGSARYRPPPAGSSGTCTLLLFHVKLLKILVRTQDKVGVIERPARHEGLEHLAYIIYFLVQLCGVVSDDITTSYGRRIRGDTFRETYLTFPWSLSLSLATSIISSVMSRQSVPFLEMRPATVGKPWSASEVDRPHFMATVQTDARDKHIQHLFVPGDDLPHWASYSLDLVEKLDLILAILSSLSIVHHRTLEHIHSPRLYCVGALLPGISFDKQRTACIVDWTRIFGCLRCRVQNLGY